MILQSLVDYYEELASQEKIARPGWSKVKVSWGLEIDENGHLLNILPFRHLSPDGKKMLPREMEMPAQVKRSSGVSANFLCDNSSYILAADNKNKQARTNECFNAAKALHSEILSDTDSNAAKAIINFFLSWQPENLDNLSFDAISKDDLISGSNITFLFEGIPVSEYSEIRSAWQRYYDNEKEGTKQVCLITGNLSKPESVHPAIKNVRGAQSSGAALVSFNAPAFCSYGKEQNINAPVSKYAAFAYTSALNYLLADRSHVKVIGNTTVVYWAKDAAAQYQDVFAALLDGGNDMVTDEDLNSLMAAISAGNEYDFEGLPIKPENEFYILGISPNASRLSVRFFYRNSFGTAIRNLKKHYDDIAIISDNRNKWINIPLWALLRETVNPKASDKSPLPQLSGDMLKSMINGTRYPETLFYQTMLRIRAEHNVTQGKAAIIKGYLIRNINNLTDRNKLKEVTSVSLQSESDYTPYVLGRLFSVLESIQQDANPGINATIKDRFFNSACATPAATFPILLKLSNSHIRKLNTGKAVFWSKQLGELTEKLGEFFPDHLSLQEQGAFILGYYHQTQKRYEKKN